MCNLYSITTNQTAIISVPRVVNRNAATSRRCRAYFPTTLPRRGHRDGDDAMGHADTTAHRRAAGHQHPQHVLTALARLAEA
jgi:hypothetical protein